MAEKILFTDDNAAVLKLVETFLKVNKYEVYTADNGQKAFEVANKIHPDLIISDVMMPKKSGFELCRDLRQNALTWHIPIMLLSAKDRTTDKVQGLAEGADDYMTKPFDLDELLARVKTLLKRSQEAMDANPSTKLPGNLSIERAIVRRITSKEKFAVCYCDLDNFKSFNDHYGFYLGDRAIKYTGMTVNTVVRELGSPADFVGHIGGDDFIFITQPENSEKLCKEIIQRFDIGIRELYDPKELERGYIVGKNRQGMTVEVPIMSLSIAVISNVDHVIEHPGQISMIEGELKEYVKKLEGSNYVVDRKPTYGRANSTLDEILIAHRNSDFAHRLRRSLKGYPFSITQARNGVEALLYVTEREPALLIVDPFIDVIDGKDLVQLIHKIERLKMLPIIFFATKETYPRIKAESEAVGINGVLLEETESRQVAEYLAQILDLKL